MLDATVKTDVTMTSEKIAIKVTCGDNISQTELTAVNQGETDPTTTSQFELVDPIMLELLKVVGHGIEATLSVAIADQEYTRSFEYLPR